jgi:methionyl-tRNA formyltransferase
MGTGPFAVPMFEALIRSAHQVLALVTRPIAASGKRKSPANPMSLAAQRAGLPTLFPVSVNDPEFVEWLRAQAADILVVCDYGQILSAECLATAKLGGINLHGSLLPRHRGAAPVQWAILQGDPTTGVSVIRMTPHLDAGKILVASEIPIASDETADQLESRLAALGPQAVLQSLDLLQAWDGKSPLGHSQDPSKVSKAPRLKKQDGLLDWSKSAVKLRNQIRAFTPWPGSFTHYPDGQGNLQRLIVHTADLQTHSNPPSPGTVLAAGSNGLVVACGQDALALRSVQPAGKKRMEAADFLRGYAIGPGTRFS